MAAVHWTHWEDVKNVYGVGPDGYARQTWDNVGVQYGLKALTDGKITPAEFLDLNATVGSWKDPGDMVQEGQPFLPVGGFDPWSLRNQRTGDPAPRRAGSIAAMNAAYREGLYFDGDIDIPIIDWRPYLEERARHAQQPPVVRLAAADARPRRPRVEPGDLVLGAGRRADVLEAFQVMDEWLLDGRPAGGAPTAASRRPAPRSRAARASGTGSSTRGPTARARRRSRSTRRRASWPAARCAAASTSARCSRSSKAIARGLYGSWKPTAAERARLEQIFPTGVCDYTKDDVGRPRHHR